MDGSRFDSLARSIATWTSRRRFAKGLAAGAAGGFLGWRGVRAQGGEEGPTEAVIAAIVENATSANAGLIELRTAVEDYRTTLGGLDPFAFDMRLGQFLEDLIEVTRQGMEDAPSWTALKQVDDYFLKVNLIVGAISAGGDTDVQLSQYAISTRPDQATPTVPDECATPERTETCTATCLDVWEVRQTLALDNDDREFLAEAFKNFLECWAYFKAPDIANGCLASLIDVSCIGQVICGCNGNCH